MEPTWRTNKKWAKNWQASHLFPWSICKDAHQLTPNHYVCSRRSCMWVIVSRRSHGSIPSVELWVLTYSQLQNSKTCYIHNWLQIVQLWNNSLLITMSTEWTSYHVCQERQNMYYIFKQLVQQCVSLTWVYLDGSDIGGPCMEWEGLNSGSALSTFQFQTVIFWYAPIGWEGLLLVTPLWVWFFRLILPVTPVVWSSSMSSALQHLCVVCVLCVYLIMYLNINRNFDQLKHKCRCTCMEGTGLYLCFMSDCHVNSRIAEKASELDALQAGVWAGCLLLRIHHSHDRGLWICLPRLDLLDNIQYTF